MVKCTVLVANDHHIITKQHLSVSSQCNTITLTPLPPAGNQPTWTMDTATTYIQLWGDLSKVLAREPPIVCKAITYGQFGSQAKILEPGKLSVYKSDIISKI